MILRLPHTRTGVIGYVTTQNPEEPGVDILKGVDGHWSTFSASLSEA